MRVVITLSFDAFKSTTILLQKNSLRLFLHLYQKYQRKKTFYLTCDFTMNLLQVENNTDTENVFDTVTDLNFNPLIVYPVRITTNTKSLINDILYNDFSSNIVSGNITVGISGHISQYALLLPRNMPNRTNHNTTITVDTIKDILENIKI